MSHIPGTKTEENLHSAFAGESMANRKYLFFAKIARQLGNEEIAKLFEETAHQETGHAFAHLELMYPPADLTVEKLLEIAIEGELYETNQMYPGFEQTAREEGRLDAVAEFQEQGKESAEHADVFLQAAKRFKALGLVERYHATRYEKALDKVKNSSEKSEQSPDQLKQSA
ncbi:MAG: rubrerythrin family protein [Candidatus Melainabacteria bacterium]|mgnify:CR=1 FL=1|nr:rubrerythrin family protein [Candidatus Melainabacteria bacterium]